MRNRSVVGIMRSTQVLTHPALVTNQYRVVRVAVNVGDGGGVGTGWISHYNIQNDTIIRSVICYSIWIDLMKTTMDYRLVKKEKL